MPFLESCLSDESGLELSFGQGDPNYAIVKRGQPIVFQSWDVVGTCFAHGKIPCGIQPIGILDHATDTTAVLRDSLRKFGLLLLPRPCVAHAFVDKGSPCEPAMFLALRLLFTLSPLLPSDGAFHCRILLGQRPLVDRRLRCPIGGLSRRRAGYYDRCKHNDRQPR